MNVGSLFQREINNKGKELVMKTITQKIDGRSYGFKGLEGVKELKETAAKKVAEQEIELKHWKKVDRWCDDFMGIKRLSKKEKVEVKPEDNETE